MRHITLEYISKLVRNSPKLEKDRAPVPMPGRRYPTRVAWQVEVAERRIIGPPGFQRPEFYRNRKLAYIGKPNRYRALEAFRLFDLARQGKLYILSSWQAEFDKAGLVAYAVAGGMPCMCTAYAAYHPHNAQVDIIPGFTKPFFLKYVGGMRLYSQKKKLGQDAIDAYYTWYQKVFKKKLRRPKAVPTAVIGGEVVKAEEDIPF